MQIVQKTFIKEAGLVLHERPSTFNLRRHRLSLPLPLSLGGTTFDLRRRRLLLPLSGDGARPSLSSSAASYPTRRSPQAGSGCFLLKPWFECLFDPQICATRYKFHVFCSPLCCYSIGSSLESGNQSTFQCFFLLLHRVLTMVTLAQSERTLHVQIDCMA